MRVIRGSDGWGFSVELTPRFIKKKYPTIFKYNNTASAGHQVVVHLGIYSMHKYDHFELETKGNGQELNEIWMRYGFPKCSLSFYHDVHSHQVLQGLCSPLHTATMTPQEPDPTPARSCFLCWDVSPAFSGLFSAPIF